MSVTRLTRAIPVLPSLKVADSLAFFKQLGFSAWAWEDPPSYGGVTRDGAELHFFTTDRKEVCEWTSCRVDVDDINGIHEQALAAGCIHPNGGLEDKPWGYREFAILDPFGVLVTFGQNLED
jgi:catechol 2,3-dioxygenase-like lactoylglutathione lyase family enzyme